jgi:hypothetical protein
MQNYILYSAVDQAIVDRSGNQAPASAVRVRAINSELDLLQATYDLFDSVREIEITVITDGTTAYDVSDLVPDNDVKTIKDFNLGTDENAGSPIFTYLDYPAFMRRIEGGTSGNYYTLYTVDGVQYLRVLTFDPSSTAVAINMLYHTTYKALDNDNDFIPAVINDAGIKILLPARFKELVALGALIRLFYPAIGEDSLKYLNVLKSEYEDLKVKLGLTVAKAPSRVERKFHLRKQW